MIKKIKVEEGVGKPLLHDITGILENGFKGVMFERGYIIKEEDIEKLKDIGKDHIFVGELEPDEVHEEEAILELAPYLIGENISYSEPKEGKTNLTADVDGLFLIDSEGLFEINNLGDYTVATINNYKKVKAGDRLAGGRIIPLFTKRETADKAVEIAKKYFPIFEVKEFQKLKIGTIITGDEVYYGRIEDKFEEVLRRKFEKYDTEILGFTKCPDDLEKIDKALNDFLEAGADVVIFTGGMSVDPDDLTPTAIKNSSEELLFQGVPIQPGNMLTVGKVKNSYLVGVPGASIHSPATSFDILLPRLYGKVEIKREDFIKLGEGSLELV